MGPASPFSLSVVARFGGDEDGASLSVYKEALSVPPSSMKKTQGLRCRRSAARRCDLYKVTFSHFDLF